MKMHVVDRDTADGYCTACRKDVIVGADRACPGCGQPVHPLSLPVVPRAEPAAIALQGRPAPPAHSDTAISAANGPSMSDSAARPTETIMLPHLDAATAWHADTVALRATLADEEARLAEELRRVRGSRKLLDAVLDRLTVEDAPERAEPPTPASPAPMVPATASPPSPAAERPAGGRVQLGPDVPASRLNGRAVRAAAAAPTRWARDHDACRNCGADATGGYGSKHAAGGRCFRCYQYFRSRGAERPRERWSAADA